jgi:hypothetical protein
MRRIRFSLLLSLLAWPFVAGAFIPPLPALLHEMFDNRKHTGDLELLIRHRVERQPGEVQMIDERVLVDRGKLYFLWTGVILGRPYAGVLDHHNYMIGGKAFPSGSSVLMKYLSGASADEMQNILIGESFIRRDQLYEFQPGASFEGDPASWNLKAIYMRHPDIYLHRLGQEAAIAVAGLDEPSRKRIVYFDRGFRGIRGLEWKDGDNAGSWILEGFSGSGVTALPHRLTFNFNGAPLITSNLSAKVVKEKQASEFRAAWRSAGSAGQPSGDPETFLKIVLSYR